LTAQSQAAQTPLAAGANYVTTKNVTIPVRNVQPGNRYLLFVADQNQVQPETEEANNVVALPIDIRGPDLVVSAAVAPSSTILDQDLSITWTVTTQGPGPASANWSDCVYLSDDTVLDNNRDAAESDTTLTCKSPPSPLGVGASYVLTQKISS